MELGIPPWAAFIAMDTTGKIFAYEQQPLCNRETGKWEPLDPNGEDRIELIAWTEDDHGDVQVPLAMAYWTLTRVNQTNR